MKRGYIRRRPRKRTRDLETEMLERTWKSNLGPCVVCPYEGEECEGRVTGHHIIEKQTIRRRSLGKRAMWDLRNRLPVCEGRHHSHTSRAKPIPRAVLPESAFAFAEDHGLSWLLDKIYPPPDPVPEHGGGP